MTGMRNTTRWDWSAAWRAHERCRAEVLREAYGPLAGDNRDERAK